MRVPRLRSPELPELRAFVLAARTGSMARAAAQLHVSTPAVAKRVRHLEALAGTPLLERSSRGVRPTPSGSVLLDAAERVLTHADALLDVLQPGADPRTAISGLHGLLHGAGRAPSTEAVLTEVEAILARVFQGTNDAIVVSRPQDGTIHEVNDAFCMLMGRSRQELLGRSSLELDLWGDPRDRPRAVATSTSDGPTPIRLSIRHASGALREVELVARPIRVAGEERLLTTLRDCSAERLEGALEVRVRQLALVADLAVEAAEATSIDGLLGAAVSRLGGALGAEVAVYAFERPARALRVAAATPALAASVPVGRLVAAPGPDTSMLTAVFDSPDLRADGLTRPLTSIVEGGRGPYGVLAAYGPPGQLAADEHAMFLDVAASVLGVATRRMEAEIALGEREATLTAFFEAAADAMLIADDDRRFVDANDAALRLLGYAREELLALRIEDVLPPDEAEEIQARWSHFLQAGTLLAPGRVRCADGTCRDVEFHSRARFLPGRHLTVFRPLARAPLPTPPGPPAPGATTAEARRPDGTEGC